MNNKDLYVEIAIKYHGGYESEIDNQVAELHNKLLKYKCGYGGLLLGNYYFIEYQSKLFMEIKRLCEKQKCYDAKNFAAIFKRDMSNFIMKGKGQSWTIELSIPGKDNAKELLESLCNNE